MRKNSISTKFSSSLCISASVGGYKVILSFYCSQKLRSLSSFHAERTMLDSYFLQVGEPIKQTQLDLFSINCPSFTACMYFVWNEQFLIRDEDR